MNWAPRSWNVINGLACAVMGIASSIAADTDRIDRGCVIFDTFHAGLSAQAMTIKKGRRS